ncbi:hypothetical protein [Roseovarius aestuariivivens]|uniref:hypothetical protein n=1 Tax=Roseovarius aestuariivivens TaxID=1888910 RepID=UPI0010809F99|nr:hypothetical protein [Roseovarius aestuariivivens]
MSAPNTNVEKQEKKHKPMLSGGVLFAIIGAVIVLALIVYMSLGGKVPVAGDVEPVVNETQSE